MKYEFSDILVLIPAYDPDEKMISYVRNLEQEGFEHILLVDDAAGRNASGVLRSLRVMSR